MHRVSGGVRVGEARQGRERYPCSLSLFHVPKTNVTIDGAGNKLVTHPSPHVHVHDPLVVLLPHRGPGRLLVEERERERERERGTKREKQKDV